MKTLSVMGLLLEDGVRPAQPARAALGVAAGRQQAHAGVQGHGTGALDEDRVEHELGDRRQLLPDAGDAQQQLLERLDVGGAPAGAGR